MHPYLIRLGIRPEVQEFFAPYYLTDSDGDLVFDYGSETETYGFAYHRVPVSVGLWSAGQKELSQIRQVFISNNAMDALAYLHYNYHSFVCLNSLLFIAVGARCPAANEHWICYGLSKKKTTFLFGNDFLGKVQDVKMAAAIRQFPLTVVESDNLCTIHFRHRNYSFAAETFSLSAFEKLSRFRFGLRVVKPKRFNSFFEQLKASAF